MNQFRASVLEQLILRQRPLPLNDGQSKVKQRVVVNGFLQTDVHSLRRRRPKRTITKMYRDFNKPTASLTLWLPNKTISCERSHSFAAYSQLIKEVFRRAGSRGAPQIQQKPFNVCDYNFFATTICREWAGPSPLPYLVSASSLSAHGGFGQTRAHLETVCPRVLYRHRK